MRKIKKPVTTAKQRRLNRAAITGLVTLVRDENTPPRMRDRAAEMVLSQLPKKS